MKILVLNRGSSSVKCCLYDFPTMPEEWTAPIWEEKIEWKNIGGGSFEEDFKKLLPRMSVDCIGHRIVHGGSKYRASVLIDADVKAEIRKLASLAPLHNLADLEGIEILEKWFPQIPQVAVFDTAFHHTMPLHARVYPGPYEWVDQGILRFGFHGTSFQYCAKRAKQLHKKEIPKMVICHLGSGASLCAVLNGQSIDTTMGFTPLEGVMMDTRSGTIDPGIIFYLLKQKNPSEMEKELYERSGLLGLSGVSSDMRDVLEEASNGNHKARLAIDVYVHRLSSMIGSMVVSLGGLDALVFTGGIGENAAFIRTKVCEKLSFLGLRMDSQIANNNEDTILSSKNSEVKVFVIHTQEAFEIARECFEKIHK